MTRTSASTCSSIISRIRCDVASEVGTGDLNKRVPAAVNVNWTNYLAIAPRRYEYLATVLGRYDKGSGESDSLIADERIALLAQQQLAKVLLKLLHPTADGRLRVSKRKLAVLFNKIGVSI